MIEYNNVHHTCQNSSDCGGIHSGRDWTYVGLLFSPFVTFKWNKYWTEIEIIMNLDKLLKLNGFIGIIALKCEVFLKPWILFQRGNIIRKNHIHHTLRFLPGADVRGIMLDDQYSSVTIEDNVFYDVSWWQLRNYRVLWWAEMSNSSELVFLLAMLTESRST